jgi:HEAT repeat protein
MLLGSPQARLSRAALDHVGPDVPRLLVDIANHPAEAAQVRVRALSGLVFYPTPDARSFLGGLLHEPTLSRTAAGAQLRAEALRTLGHFGEDSVETIAALREDPAPEVRAAAAEGLGHTRSEQARQVLEAWLGLEPSLPVRAAIDAGLRRLRGY